MKNIYLTLKETYQNKKEEFFGSIGCIALVAIVFYFIMNI